MAGPFYFAWLDAYADFDAEIHAVDDEDIYSIEISQSEGEFASLSIEIDNPRVGLLAAGRKQYCWLSWDSGTGVVPLFTGRLVGVPADLHNEVITITFAGRPDDYADQKAALAETLKVPPFWDPVWLSEQADDPDTVLEARTQRWHIDRVTHAVSVSDIIIGEDGTVDIGEDDHFYDDMGVSYGQTPLRRVTITATLTWPQEGEGDIDLTRELVAAFQAAGSPAISPLVSSLTGDGLLGSWPAPDTSIGQGWSIAAGASIVAAQVKPVGKPIVFLRENDVADEAVAASPTFSFLTGLPNTPSAAVLAGSTRYSVVFDLGVYAVAFIVHWAAARPRSETVTFTLEADIQSLFSDPGADEEEAIQLSSDLAGQPVDPDGALPIGSLLRNAYLPTDRGQQSFQYLLALPRAKLLARARAVFIKLVMPWTLATIGLTLRKNIHLTDSRLPGGEAQGKITALSLIVSGDSGDMHVEATIGCTIGHGGSVAATSGIGVYAAPGYMQSGYQRMTGKTIDPGTADLTYQGFDDLDVVDDDGLNLFNLTAADVINSLTVAGGVSEQLEAIQHTVPPDDPVTALQNLPTVVSLSLKPVTGRTFNTTFAPEISTLVVPKTIDLEAAA